MLNTARKEFEVLHVSRSNYISWSLDVKLHLNAMNMRKVIDVGNNEPNDSKLKGLIFIRYHFNDDLKNKYLTVKDR